MFSPCLPLFQKYPWDAQRGQRPTFRAVFLQLEDVFLGTDQI
jgi:hypothetical protein